MFFRAFPGFCPRSAVLLKLRTEVNSTRDARKFAAIAA
jgi:hypothetical protein